MSVDERTNLRLKETLKETEAAAGAEPQVIRIVLTGGPCAGKTTALSWIKNEFGRRGYRVLIVPETATELLTGGVAPWTCSSNLQYQVFQMHLQLEKERIFTEASSGMKADKVLIICDRGALDNKAYMDDQEFEIVLNKLGLSEVELRDTYDAVFHLVTAAKGAEEAYTTSNNQARTETVEEAVRIDERIVAAWTGHPHLRIIDNSTGFEAKLRRLLSEITAFLGEPVSMQIQRKYLIRFPDLAWLEQQESCKRVEIIQTYLYSADDEEIRVRQRGVDGHFVYYETKKRKINGVKRYIIERRLSYEEYLTCLLDADVQRRPVRKTRYCLTWENQYYEIDVYPFWKDRAVLEIELQQEDLEIRIPDQLNVIREITDEDAYKNAAISIKIPEEEI